MSSKKYVTTVSGKKLLIEKTQKFNKLYYEVGDPTIENSGDCYLMDDGKHYRFETGLLFFNHTVKKYTLNSQYKTIVSGVIDENENLGYFSVESDNIINIYLKNGNVYPLLSREVIKNNLNYREKLDDGCFYHILRLKTIDFIKISTPSPLIKQSLPYDSHNHMNRFIKNYNNNSIAIDDDSVELAKVLKNYSFGLEFETIAGNVPKDLCNNNGLIPLRDGSIAGLEFVTIPLVGAKGIQTVKNNVGILKERTIFDDQCSMHLHIGNIPRTKEFILAFAITTIHIQNDIFKMFPLYKKYNFNYKNKNYSAPYPTEQLLSQLDPIIDEQNIDKNFNIIFRFLSGGNDFSNYYNDLNNVKTHPNNPTENQKWNVNTRYFIHNLIPIIFGNKETIEFRIHTPTYDINKILAFLILNVSIIDYVNENTKVILNSVNSLDVFNILRHQLRNFPHRGDLMSYFQERVRVIEIQNRNSKIFEKEETIPCYFNRILSQMKEDIDPFYKNNDDDIFKNVPDLKKVLIKNYKSNFIKPIMGTPSLKNQSFEKSIENYGNDLLKKIEILNEDVELTTMEK